MKHEKGPVRSLKSMASRTCSSFALTIQLWGKEEGNACTMIDILNGYAVQKCITLGCSCVNKNSCIMVDPCLYNITYLMIMMLYQCGIHWNKVKLDLQS